MKKFITCYKVALLWRFYLFLQSMGILYIVPTPVGNMEDITLRALRVLREVDLILAEDTRTSGVLLKHYEIKNRVVSHHKFNEHQSIEKIIEKLCEGQNIALISDAGTPGISDPGHLLAREAARKGIEVQCLPGATACIPAVVASGLACDRFCFEGFLPVKKGRRSRLELLKEEQRTIILYESPHRLLRSLEQLSDLLGACRQAAVVREISKVHEETLRGTLQELVEHFADVEPRGEMVVIVAGKDTKQQNKRPKKAEEI